MANNIGIDLGTTNSVVAIVENNDVKILRNSEGLELTPSVIFFSENEGNDEPLVGTIAKNSAASSPDNVVQFMKREMGNKNYTYHSLSGNSYTPESLSAILLKKMKQDSEMTLGVSEIKNAVITVPAYFDDGQRTATKQAGEIAGLNVLRIINEPTAAALAFGVDTSKEGKVLVYDLGGGTFDVTLLDIEGGDFKVVETTGDSALGGINFDQIIVSLFIEQLEELGCEVSIENDLLNADIREKAEITKIQLSNVEAASSAFTVDGKTHKVRITREEFEAASKHLLDRTKLYLEDVFESQSIGWENIDHLLVIGGSTRMAMVKKMLEEYSGKDVKYLINPDTAVAMGAAILADMLEVKDNEQVETGSSFTKEFNIQDVTSQSLGVVTLDGDTDNEYNSIIIPHNTKIPEKRSKEYYTVVDNQSVLRVQVTEGNDPELEYVKIIGEQLIDIPVYPKGSPIGITFAYDIDQTIFIEIFDNVTNKSVGTFEIDRSSNLNEDEVSQAMNLIKNTIVE